MKQKIAKIITGHAVKKKMKMILKKNDKRFQ